MVSLMGSLSSTTRTLAFHLEPLDSILESCFRVSEVLGSSVIQTWVLRRPFL